MLQRGGRLLLSPSDLNNFLACEHRTALDLARARGEILLERVPRPDAELVAERGREHERGHLARLPSAGLDVGGSRRARARRRRPPRRCRRAAT